MIRQCCGKETPFLGICLGLQLLFERSDEAPGAEGLGLLEGEILKIPGSGRPEDTAYGMEFSAP